MAVEHVFSGGRDKNLKAFIWVCRETELYSYRYYRIHNHFQLRCHTPRTVLRFFPFTPVTVTARSSILEYVHGRIRIRTVRSPNSKPNFWRVA